MYNEFFKFREKPFRLVPDHKFLFLGSSHEEALAHLNFAVSQQEGFVEITGEVGTGKTTLCRMFLETLGPEVETAFIFNSKLDATQLLKFILAELGIESSSMDTADMTARLYDYLLDQKSLGRSVVLLIDEAQNLSRQTLEQLRLLSNLETTTSKLLQIILVGQPELGEILDSHDLRQLRQRISLSCQIMPLTGAETRQYIAHRINLASFEPQTLFTPKALGLIARCTKGIPRQINMVCDRCLLAAFSRDKGLVTRKMAKIAIRELSLGPWTDMRGILPPKVLVPALMMALLTAGLAAGYFFPKNLSLIHRPDPGQEQVQKAKSIPVSPMGSRGPVPGDPRTKKILLKERKALARPGRDPDPLPLLSGPDRIQSFLARTLEQASRVQALTQLLGIFGMGGDPNRLKDLESIRSDHHFFKAGAKLWELEVLGLDKYSQKIARFNLPAILEVSHEHQIRYLVIEEITSQGEYVVQGTASRVKIRQQDLAPFLGQRAFLVWKNIFGYPGVIAPGSSSGAIISLKLALKKQGFLFLDLEPVYDQALVRAVKTFQADHGLASDGLAGPMTKIMLFSKIRGRQKSVPSTHKGIEP